MPKYDFCGWATRNNIRCSDGRTILKDAFKDNDGQKVPLVWNHRHGDPNEVLGHAILENRPEGVFAYGFFNETDTGQTAKMLVQHGDINALSIYANKLKHQGGNVTHGAIREVSLVLAGANPGAYIESVMKHGEESDEEARIFTGLELELYHSEKKEEEDKEEIIVEESVNEQPKDNKGDTKVAEENKNVEFDENETVEDVFNTLNEKQKTVVYALIGQALEDGGNGSAENQNGNQEEEENMKHNVFDEEYGYDNTDVLTHAEMEAIFTDAHRLGSLRESVLQHGIEDIEYLFPDARSLTNEPEFISRDMEWVQKVMGGTKHSPFSRIKSLFANITEDDARARGYIKGNMKVEEVFGLLKRQTTPTTVYKKQKLDRDDVVDITDFDVVAWLKKEMRMMLDEEIARAILVGDGRNALSEDKIKEDCIRPILTDADLFTIKKQVNVASTDTDDAKAKAVIRAAVKARKDYKGSGNPTFFTTEDMLTDMLLMEDLNQRVIYETVDKLKNALRVSDIVTVPVLEGMTGPKGGDLIGIIVNLSDYNVGADKGGEVNMFDDFDIDYNAQKYLIETRCSGALIKPYSAIELEFNETK